MSDQQQAVPVDPQTAAYLIGELTRGNAMLQQRVAQLEAQLAEEQDASPAVQG